MSKETSFPGGLKVRGESVLPGALGASAQYAKTTNGAQTLLPASNIGDRLVHIIVTVAITFAAGDGAVPSFNIGETGTPAKFKAALNSGAAGAQLIYTGVLQKSKALLVTGTPATGTTSAGAVQVSAIAAPLL